MVKSFFRYVLPSMLAFAFSGLYTIVDGFFIGRNIGDLGLAAVNIAYPLAALLQAVGTGIGMGGAIQLSVCRGKNDRIGEKSNLAGALVLLLTAGAVMTAVLLLAGKPALTLLGAQGQVLEAGLQYSRIIAAGAMFQLCATGLTPLLRNYGGAVAAMGAMIGGFLTNIALDALFVAVLGYGMKGAAWATVIGQMTTALPCAFFLWKRAGRISKNDFEPRNMPAICGVGLSPFGLTISPFLVIILMNRSAGFHGGAPAVAAYAVISYVIAVAQLLLQGIGDGSQPLMSLYAGMAETGNVIKIRNYAYGFAFVVALGSMTGIFALRGWFPGFFGASGQAASIAGDAFPVVVLGFLCIAFCRTTTAYFYAAQKNMLSYLMVYGEPVVLWGLLGFLPKIYGLAGVWRALPGAQLTLSGLACLLLLLDTSKIRSGLFKDWNGVREQRPLTADHNE